MARALPIERDLTQFYQQFCVELAQAQTVAAGVACCTALLDTCFAPVASFIVWDAGHNLRVFGPSPHPDAPLHPAPNEMASLQRGELAIRSVDDGLVCFAPLRARGELVGWFALQDPAWTAESASLLTTIAAQSGPVLAMLDAAHSQMERVAHLQTLNEIGRLLNGVLDLDKLLDAIFAATRRLFNAPNFYIALYDATADMLDMAYLVRDGERYHVRDRWNAGTGLAGEVVRSRKPLCTDDYTKECRKRGLNPRTIADRSYPRAWVAVPLIAHDRLLGVMNVNSLREGYTYTADQVDLLATIASQAAVAIENARLYQRSERQARQLETLNRIGRTITSSLDPEQVPSLIMDQVTQLLGAEEGSLLLADDATGDLVFAYTTGPVGNRLLGHRLPRGAGLAGYVAIHGQSVIVNDVQRDERFDNSTDRTTGFVTRSLLAVPLRGVGGVQGVIEVLNSRDGVAFTEEDQRLLEAVADQAVIALENARRFAQVDQALARRAQELALTNDRLQHNLRSLTALNALGMAINTALRTPDEIFSMTARGVVEMTDALGAYLLLAEGAAFRTAVCIGLAGQLPDAAAPLLRQVIAAARPQTFTAPLPLPLAQHGAQALFVVPLRATQQTLGVLCVYYADALPDAPDQETAVLFATQAAVAVESLALFTAVRDARDQMASVLASTREGIMLIAPDGSIAITNAALHRICGLAPQTLQHITIEQFLMAWERTSGFTAEEWAAMRRGLDLVMAGRDPYASGELNGIGAQPRFVAWTALRAMSSGASRGGSLLVLRDIAEAKEAERLRQDLTNMIVHDLRSPLSSVMASIDLLVKGVSGVLNDAQRGVLGIAYTSAIQMLDMINTLLDISRLEDGRMPLELARCAVGPMLQRAVEGLNSLARERMMVIQCDMPPDLPDVLADRELIGRVLQNLIGNALKFSGRGSTVLVRVFADDDAVTIAISDRGIGIAPEDQEKIFAKFGQVGERRGGTGLGLTFCKLVVEAHHGCIWVESAPGQGSTFSFLLPRA